MPLKDQKISQTVLENIDKGDWLEFQTPNGLKRGQCVSIEEETPIFSFYVRENLNYYFPKSDFSFWVLVPTKEPTLYRVSLDFIKFKIYNPTLVIPGLNLASRFELDYFPDILKRKVVSLRRSFSN